MELFWRILLVLAMGFAFAGCERHPAPSLNDLQGHHINLGKYRDKWIIINYWASWCRPCWQEIPSLNAFYKAHKGDILVLGVNFDQAPIDQQIEDVKRMGIAFPVLNSDPAAIFNFKRVTGLPTTFIIAPSGKLHRVLFGEQTQESLEQAMQQS